MCKYCEEQELIPCNGYNDVQIWYHDDKSFLSTYVYEYGDGYEISAVINYCPMCGQKL